MGESLGDRLMRLREERGLSRAELARRVGVSNQAATAWERAGSQPHMRHLRRIASVLGVGLEDLSPPVDDEVAAAGAWAAFLATPEGQSMSPEERQTLSSIDWQDREPTPQVLAALLAVVRMSPPAATKR